ncbi:PREDICTED: uncharacterized protein LOC106746142 isoform X2 [Dinoponera quadriceps]|uniref:Uncharacterized protein LOC106746142 isoform X2 n=1 Tax=Dinoponera quadriceps TaxID=609295 RepID=A0A6P3XI32_DINQU|nr:PREDICTED: uncharacterized protein LOC106746142 isoform X2 [Dinoponera quadriceps]
MLTMLWATDFNLDPKFVLYYIFFSLCMSYIWHIYKFRRDKDKKKVIEDTFTREATLETVTPCRMTQSQLIKESLDLQEGAQAVNQSSIEGSNDDPETLSDPDQDTIASLRRQLFLRNKRLSALYRRRVSFSDALASDNDQRRNACNNVATNQTSNNSWLILNNNNRIENREFQDRQSHSKREQTFTVSQENVTTPNDLTFIIKPQTNNNINLELPKGQSLIVRGPSAAVSLGPRYLAETNNSVTLSQPRHHSDIIAPVGEKNVTHDTKFKENSLIVSQLNSGNLSKSNQSSIVSQEKKAEDTTQEKKENINKIESTYHRNIHTEYITNYLNDKTSSDKTDISRRSLSPSVICKPNNSNLITSEATANTAEKSFESPNFDSQAGKKLSENSNEKLNNQLTRQPCKQPGDPPGSQLSDPPSGQLSNKPSDQQPSNQANKSTIGSISQEVHLQLALSNEDETHVSIPNVLIPVKARRRKEEKCSQQKLVKFSINGVEYNIDRMKKVKIAIIGAGASGIAAASRLLQEGVDDFVLLEANDRIGGRINTVNFGSNVVDLGAQWVHGETGNIVNEFASKHNLLGSFCTFFNPSKHEFFTISGEKIPKEESIEALTIYYNMMKEAPNELGETEGSFGDYFRENFYKSYSEKPFVSRNRAAQFFSWMQKVECSVECSDSLSDVSAKRLADYWECEGDSVQNWKDRGYKTLFDLLMKKIPNAENSLPVMEKIEFNKVVTTIDYSSEEGVIVTTSDGWKYIASHVIFTGSLGVLKKKHSTMFVPSLPSRKKCAIRGLCIGTADKIFMEFPHKWWSEDTVAINLVCLEENKKLFLQKYGEEYRWLCDVFSFYTVDYQPRILCAWIVGKYARYMETLSDSEVTNGLYWLLYESVGKYYNIVQPIKILRSKWFTDEHFQGSYTFQGMNTEDLNVKPSDLAEPIVMNGKPVILFAGEATHDHYYSTVHGAVETGFREANRLLDFNQRTRDCLDQLVHNVNNIHIGENEQAMYDAYNERTTIVIVGAGIAGIAAARTLQNAGLDFIILEAEDRIGGRIHSVQLDDGWIELGAQYLHGDQSQLAEYCREKDLLSRFFGTDGEGLYLRDNGCTISSGTVLACDVNDAIHDALHSSEQFFKQKIEKISDGESVGTYVRKNFDKYLSECNDPPPVRRMKEEIFDFKMRYLQVDNSCDSMYDLSVKMWGQYEIAGKDKYQMFKEGYVSLLDSLGKDIALDKFRLNCPVESIHWRSSIPSQRDSAILVRTREDKRILCDAVIVTCSLGVLKSCHEKMFHPPLPFRMRCAIKNLGFGVVNKIILRYDHPWWYAPVTGFQILPIHDRPEMPPLPQWTKNITGFDVLPNHTSILVGWISGEGARAIESIPEVTIGLHVTALLSRYMNRSIPPPTDCFRSKWYANEYIRGGYCNITTSCENEDVSTCTLSEPIWAEVKDEPFTQIPVLMLAGEATHDRYFSTVHGAYETGIHRAKLCSLYYRKSM